MRLDKFLCDSIEYTRSEAKLIIKKKKVTVNNTIITDPGFIINELSDEIIVNGEKLTYERFRYYLLNKPAGYISATHDATQKTVMELLKDVNTKDCFPVGRLDKDTEGLLIISNDGELAHKLLSPKKHAKKTYLVHLEQNIIDEEINTLENGIDIGEKKPTLPCKIQRINDNQLYITITEGKYHQIKRMFEKINNKVIYLKRISFGSIKLDETLELGKYRVLTFNEVSTLYDLVE